MRNKFVLIVLVFCQTLAFAQIDLQKLGTTYRYIDNGEMEKAKKLLDEMNGKKEYQSDARYWLTRTSYYIKIVSAKTNSKEFISRNFQNRWVAKNYTNL